MTTTTTKGTNNMNHHHLADLLDDLTPRHMTALLNWLWVNNHPVTRANIKAWRKKWLNSKTF